MYPRTRLQRLASIAWVTVLACLSVPTLGVSDNWKPIPRHIPPKGIQVPAAELQRLVTRLKKTQAALQQVESRLSANADVCDAEIYTKAVELALRHGEFYRKGDVQIADWALGEANARIEQIAKNKQPWAMRTGLVVRGYRSNIDDSAQPYGLEIPKTLDRSKPAPLYVWLHGRGDKTTDLYFIHQRSNKLGKIQPDDAIVLHPFGRHCMGYKSAGEIDVLDAIKSVKSRYNIDPDRVVLMGFSMGGAGAWHLGARYVDQWAAIHAGAGFAETRQYIKLKPENYPASYVQTLWTLHDVPNYVRNLFNVPVIAYSGEVDKQKQAADVMEAAFNEHGRKLPHIIGPKMGHKYDPASLAKVMDFMSKAVAKGRDPFASRVSLQTRTLRYPRVHWLTVRALRQHWQDCRVDATAGTASERRIKITTSGITGLEVSVPWRGVDTIQAGTQITINDSHLTVATDTPRVRLIKDGAAWRFKSANELPDRLRKKHGLQGPIDDAFLSRFVVVVPTGQGVSREIDKWVEFELAHFVERWHNLYRATPRVVKDVDLTQEDMERSNLILWGDSKSNRVISRVLAEGQFPFKWNDTSLTIRDKQHDATQFALVAIYPNPLSPNRYVVFNSGPTHREGHDRTNSLQNPKLPDWAVIDTTVQPTNELPGGVVHADFFDESWNVKAK